MTDNNLRPNRQLSNEQFIEKVEKRFPGRFSFSKTSYQGNRNPVTLTCHLHGDITLRAEELWWKKHGCPICTDVLPILQGKEKYINKAREIHGQKYDYSKVVYLNSNTPVEIICPEHGSFFIDLYNHARGIECKECSFKTRTKTTHYFIEKARKLYGDRYDYSETIYTRTQGKVKIRCHKHGVFEQRASSHLQGNGCLQCHNESKSNTEEHFITDAKRVHGDIYDYSQVRYITSKIKVEIHCKSHGAFWVKPNAHVSSRAGCPRCKDSKGERFISNELNKMGIPFIREYRIEGTMFRFDFYLPEQNILIEFHGIQHFEPVERFGGVTELIATKERDIAKMNLAFSKSIPLITLDHRLLSANTLSYHLKQELQRLYRHWYLIDGKVLVFRRCDDVYKYFGIPMNIEIRYMNDIVKSKVSKFKVIL